VIVKSQLTENYSMVVHSGCQASLAEENWSTELIPFKHDGINSVLLNLNLCLKCWHQVVQYL